MSIERWSKRSLVLAVVGWLTAVPVLLLALIGLGGGNLGFTPPILLLLLMLWIGPAFCLVLRWRGGRGRSVT
jgi:hypothetical protein